MSSRFILMFQLIWMAFAYLMITMNILHDLSQWLCSCLSLRIYGIILQVCIEQCNRKEQKIHKKKKIEKRMSHHILCDQIEWKTFWTEQPTKNLVIRCWSTRLTMCKSTVFVVCDSIKGDEQEQKWNWIG